MTEAELKELYISSLQAEIKKLEGLCNFLLSKPTSEQIRYQEELQKFNSSKDSAEKDINNVSSISK